MSTLKQQFSDFQVLLGLKLNLLNKESSFSSFLMIFYFVFEACFIETQYNQLLYTVTYLKTYYFMVRAHLWPANFKSVLTVLLKELKCQKLENESFFLFFNFPFFLYFL